MRHYTSYADLAQEALCGIAVSALCVTSIESRERVMRGRLIVGLVFLALPVTLCAQVTGNKLLELCRSEDANFANGYCAGYLASHAEAVSIMRHFFGSRFYCTPEEVTLSQAKEIVVSYLKNNPAQRHKLAWFLVGEALGEAFPCPQDEASPKPPPKKTPKAK